MKRYVSAKSCCSAASRLMICAWIETSSADTGSSATMKSGLTASARAMPIALALAAGELVRVAARRVRGEPDDLEQLAHARVGLACRVARPWTRSGSPTMRPTLWRGLSDANGSWKTICIRRRSGRSSASPRCVMSWPSKTIVPAGRLVEAQDRAADRRLAAAGLADEAERLAAADRRA